MDNILKKGFYFIIIILFISCGTNEITINKTDVNTNLKDVNTNPNSEYTKSRKAYSGSLNKSEYSDLIKILEVELKTTIPLDKSILINFNQQAPNCILAGFSTKDYKQIAKNRIRISSRMSSNNNAIDFFVYTKDAYNHEIYDELTEFRLDSGFFYKNVFTEHQNCEGFLIIKPNGEFYKYYGEDYYSEVKAFFNKK